MQLWKYAVNKPGGSFTNNAEPRLYFITQNSTEFGHNKAAFLKLNNFYTEF